MRGSFARRLYDYLPTHSGQFYYAFDSGPVHFLVLDSGEDKDDDTNVYAGLNRTEQYREQEFAWLQNHIQTDQRIKEARYSWAPAGTNGRNHGVLVVGQDQAANVEVSATQIKIVISDNSGKVDEEVTVLRQNR